VGLAMGVVAGLGDRWGESKVFHAKTVIKRLLNADRNIRTPAALFESLRTEAPDVLAAIPPVREDGTFNYTVQERREKLQNLVSLAGKN
ncbi:hypothetical protein ACFL2I_08110, partial [Candidatus Omnitrophota bacterium]